MRGELCCAFPGIAPNQVTCCFWGSKSSKHTDSDKSTTGGALATHGAVAVLAVLAVLAMDATDTDTAAQLDPKLQKRNTSFVQGKNDLCMQLPIAGYTLHIAFVNRGVMDDCSELFETDEGKLRLRKLKYLHDGDWDADERQRFAEVIAECYLLYETENLTRIIVSCHGGQNRSTFVSYLFQLIFLKEVTTTYQAVKKANEVVINAQTVAQLATQRKNMNNAHFQAILSEAERKIAEKVHPGSGLLPVLEALAQTDPPSRETRKRDRSTE